MTKAVEWFYSLVFIAFFLCIGKILFFPEQKFTPGRFHLEDPLIYTLPDPHPPVTFTNIIFPKTWDEVSDHPAKK